MYSRTIHVTRFSRQYLFNTFFNTRDTREISRIYVYKLELRYLENYLEKQMSASPTTGMYIGTAVSNLIQSG